MNKIELVVFDWAGTTVDYGSMAPVTVFKNIFLEEDVELNKEQINKPMGLDKKTHIRKLLEMEEVNRKWEEIKNSKWSEDDVERLYNKFENELAKVVAEYSIPIEGVVETVQKLEESGIKVGSTTGYTSEMMKDVAPRAESLGYKPSCIITPDKAGAGRPSPYMLFEAMKELNVYNTKNVVKVGDTISDIEEGKNAGVWTVGIIIGSNLLGLTQEEYANMPEDELKVLKEETARKYYEAGADFTIDSIDNLIEVVDEINSKFSNKEGLKKNSNFYNPVRLIQGKNSFSELVNLIEENKKIDTILAIVWDESLFESQVLIDIEKNKELIKLVFNKSNPSLDDLYEIYLSTKDKNIDLIVAIGGGSVMDISKSLCLLYAKNIESKEDIRNLIINKDYEKPETKWIGVPTTAGTGSEVTPWATIWDLDENKKRSTTSTDNFAYAAIVDPEFLYSQPLSLAISSAIDSITQAIECYWSKKTNLVSRIYALKAVKLMTKNLDRLIDGDKTVYDEISQASLLSGVAFSNTQTTACHGISYSLTLNYGIPHGVAVGLLLAPVMYFNEKTIIDKKSLFDALGIKSTYELELRIKNYLRKSGINWNLRLWGVKEEDLEELAKSVFAPGIFDNNPVDLSEKDVLEILKLAY